MQTFDNGAFFTVTVTAREVSAFASRWPCSGLDSRPVTFTFEKSTGDLVDSNEDANHPCADFSAVCALSRDAQAYGEKRLGVTR